MSFSCERACVPFHVSERARVLFLSCERVRVLFPCVRTCVFSFSVRANVCVLILCFSSACMFAFAFEQSCARFLSVRPRARWCACLFAGCFLLRERRRRQQDVGEHGTRDHVCRQSMCVIFFPPTWCCCHMWFSCSAMSRGSRLRPAASRPSPSHSFGRRGETGSPARHRRSLFGRASDNNAHMQAATAPQRRAQKDTSNSCSQKNGTRVAATAKRQVHHKVTRKAECNMGHG